MSLELYISDKANQFEKSNPNLIKKTAGVYGINLTSTSEDKLPFHDLTCYVNYTNITTVIIGENFQEPSVNNDYHLVIEDASISSILEVLNSESTLYKGIKIGQVVKNLYIIKKECNILQSRFKKRCLIEKEEGKNRIKYEFESDKITNVRVVKLEDEKNASNGFLNNEQMESLIRSPSTVIYSKIKQMGLDD